MNIISDSLLINISSKNGIKNNSTYLSDIYFNFKGILKDEPDIIETTFQILSAQIPYSFYNINVYNNILRLNINSINYTLTLTRGNYNANNLITEILNQLTLNGISGFNITISSITGTLKFQHSSQNFTLLYSGSTIFNVLGFDPLINYTSTSFILNAPYPLNLLGTLNLRIISDELQTNNIDSSVNGSWNVLQTIPIEQGNFGLILYDNISKNEMPLNNKYLNGFDIKIIDDNNNLVNFNNIDWNMSFIINIKRLRKDSTKTNFKDIIQPLNKLINLQTEILNQQNQNIQEDQNTQENNQEDQQNENTQENQNLDYNQDDENNLDILLYNNKNKIN